MEVLGGLLLLFGLCGMGASEGNQSFMVAAVVFSVGFGISYMNLKRGN